MRYTLNWLAALALFSSLLLPGVSFAQTTELVSASSQGVEGYANSNAPAISPDGRFVAFESYSGNLVQGDSNGWMDVFVHDRQAGVTECVSINSQGVIGNHLSQHPAISDGGRYVAFRSMASNLVPGDTNGDYDVFVHDRQSGLTRRVSVDSQGAEANGTNWYPSISASGRFVVFSSEASNLVLGDLNGEQDVFIHDLQTGMTERMSIDSQGIGGNGMSWSESSSVSANGRYVAFLSDANNLVPGDMNGVRDVFVRDRQVGLTFRVSIDSQGIGGNNWSRSSSISADGRYIAFESLASNLVPGDINAKADIFVHNLQTGLTDRISVGAQGVEGDGNSVHPSISSDGHYIAFESQASNLVPTDTNGWVDIFVHDSQAGMTERVSVDSWGGDANASNWTPSISASGRHVAFQSAASNLAQGATNLAWDILAHDRWDGLGANSIFLSGPAAAQVGVSLGLSWNTARPNSDYWLLYSMNVGGAIVRAHVIDLGPPHTVLSHGVNSGGGTGSFFSQPVPPVASGLSVYFEVITRDSGGIFYDSNVIAIAFN